MIDVRCKNCNKLLMKALMCVAAIKCPGCKMIFEYKVYSNLHLTNYEHPNKAKKDLQELSK